MHACEAIERHDTSLTQLRPVGRLERVLGASMIAESAKISLICKLIKQQAEASDPMISCWVPPLLIVESNSFF